MDVGDVLRDRMTEPRGLERMATVSIAAHAVLLAILLFAPAGLLTHPAEAPTTVMTISLGGTPGPRSTGMTSIGGRAVQEVTPPDAPKRPEAIRPPAEKAPEMTLPTPKSTLAKPSPQVRESPAPRTPTSRTPTRGKELSQGSAVAETGARGQGFGLSTGGGGGTGMTLDVGSFCCPDYLAQMIDRIRANWNQNQGTAGLVTIKYTIQRDGTLTDIQVEKATGYPALDLSAQRAVYVTKQLPPLPAQYPNQTLTLHLNFKYER